MNINVEEATKIKQTLKSDIGFKNEVLSNRVTYRELIVRPKNPNYF